MQRVMNTAVNSWFAGKRTLSAARKGSKDTPIARVRRQPTLIVYWYTTRRWECSVINTAVVSRLC
jgi:hypothetical protein